MKTRITIAILILAAAIPAAAQSCGSYQTVGNQCAMNIILPWATAGLGTDSLLTFFVPPTVSASVTFSLTQLNSSLGSSYTGYFGIFGGGVGSSKPPSVSTAASAKSFTLSPGGGGILQFTAVCFDPTCTTAAPSGAVANMFSAQFQVLASSASDLEILVPPLLTVRFLNSNGSVSFEEQEQAYATTAGVTGAIIDSVAEAATAATRYQYNASGALTLPFTVFSVTNPSSTGSLAGTAYLYDFNGNVIDTAPLPTLPPGAAAGYLLFGRSAGDTLGLFPYNTPLPVSSTDSTGVFHGALAVVFSSGEGIFLAQQFNGYAMLNLVIFD